MPVFPTSTTITTVNSAHVVPISDGSARNEISALNMWASAANQGTAASGAGATLVITAQAGSAGNNSGGDLQIKSGAPTGSGSFGSIFADTNTFSVRRPTDQLVYSTIGQNINTFFGFINSSSYVGGSEIRINGVSNPPGIFAATADVFRFASNGINTRSATCSFVPLTVTQIEADQNNWNPGVAFFYRVSSDIARSVTGLSVGQVDGQIANFRNVGTQIITFANESASSNAGNRFSFSTGANIAIAANGILRLRYDATSSRWFDW